MIYVHMTQSPHQYAAQVGAYAHVPKNEYNTLAQQLQEKERELVIRENMIAARENELRSRFSSVRDERELVYTALFGLFLLSLILLNFVLDARRARSE